MNPVRNLILLLASLCFIRTVGADQQPIEKYDRMYKRLTTMTEEKGPIGNLSETELNAFLIDIRKMMAEVGEEVENEFVSIGGGLLQKKEAQKQLILLAASEQTSKNIRKVLDPFEIRDAQIGFDEKGEGNSATLHLTCRNGTDFAVSKLRVNTKVVSEGRVVPWAEDSYVIRIRGGIEAGETRSILETVGGDLAFEPPTDMKLKVLVQIVELFDESGESVGRDVFTDGDRRALSQLEAIREDLYH